MPNHHFKLTRGQFIAKATKALAGTIALGGLTALNKPTWAAPPSQTLLDSAAFSDDEARFWQQKISELDSDPQVKDLRERAAKLTDSIKSLKIPLREVTAPMLIDGNLSDGQIMLSFDDGPKPTSMPLILNTLANHRLLSHFFCVGARAMEHPELAALAARQGHVVGSHSLDHLHLRELSHIDADIQIMDGHSAVQSATNGMAAPFFRFPYGEKSPALREFLSTFRLAEFGWNMDPNDWKFDSEYQKDLRELLHQIIAVIDEEKGGILLMHDQLGTALVLPDVLKYIKIKGLTVVTIVPG